MFSQIRATAAGVNKKCSPSSRTSNTQQETYLAPSAHKISVTTRLKTTKITELNKIIELYELPYK